MQVAKSIVRTAPTRTCIYSSFFSRGVSAAADMDPVSTGVSLAASLVTLLAVTADSCESVCSIQSRLCKAPDDIRRLAADVHTFQTLLSDVELSSRQLGDEEIPPDLRALWLKCGEQMRQDLLGFKDIADSLEQSLNGPTAIGKHVIARVRRVLSEPTVQSYQKSFSKHIEILGFIHSSISRYVSGRFRDLHQITYLDTGFGVVLLSQNELTLMFCTDHTFVPSSPSPDAKGSNLTRSR